MNTFSIYDFKRFYCEETKTLQMTHSPVGWMKICTLKILHESLIFFSARRANFFFFFESQPDAFCFVKVVII
jgi:hypothetical protein